MEETKEEIREESEIVEEATNEEVAEEQLEEETVEEVAEEAPSELQVALEKIDALEAKFAEFEQWVTETIGLQAEEVIAEEVSEEEEVASLDREFYNRQQNFI